MKKITPILLALFLFASCSKEKHCGSVYGTLEIYSDKYGQVTITGNKVNRDYFVNKNAWVRVNLLTGTYQMKRNETNETDTFIISPCGIVEIIY